VEKKNQQRAITQEIHMLELWTLCTALPRIMIFPYMKFHFNSSSRSGVTVRTRRVTDRQTDYRQQTPDNSDKNNMSPPYKYGGRHNYKIGTEKVNNVNQNRNTVKTVCFHLKIAHIDSLSDRWYIMQAESMQKAPI